MAAAAVNAVIAQSGGPTSVMNQSLAGAVEVLRSAPGIDRVYGSRFGVRGLIGGNLVDLSAVPADRLEAVARTPSAALGSTRDKPSEADCRAILDQLVQRGVGCLFYIGGNDSADTCRIIDESARARGHGLRCFHIPKTIDNDLVLNDHTPGYPSAARFVARAFMGDNLDNAALPGIKINVVMGRHAGFLTAASVLGRRHDDDGPHLVYVPERVFDPEDFVADVESVYRRLGRALVAVSEGVHDRAGNAITAMMLGTGERDPHGNIQLSGTGALGDFLAERLRQDLGRGHAKLRVRADTFGYIQRSFDEQNPLDAAEARGAGSFAARLALEGRAGGSVTIGRDSTDPYRASFGLAPLAAVAARTRRLDDAFIEGSNAITDAFHRYAGPLVGELPRHARL
jgi:6-phosphofructokinase 1